ncbi:suppressor of cytokine signaling 1-like [Myxocyprinus asiaticus]|uniref:suppressor of cytokine signaling 1-like n=1 Tax=Myxocyprinus asiaticus TaxID=70543 RepID=UPI00222238E9|nr:suppressor of cytokine signaling 1-like [Myxocyprinus asiaticus]XP_051573517.1 suppressor of cytokine signaling 1-like [Myxocyprinus asiaticus]XP_051573518.1 suppressor of cytokine signaling 1-like [Myxocyprinus asiaticus]
MVAHSSGTEESTASTEPSPEVSQSQRSKPSQQEAGSRTVFQTHFRPFNVERDFKTINKTTSMLEESGFYWGPMTVEEAHQKLKKEPVGTFLIRDSRQVDVFFTLSYKAQNGPMSVRINFKNSKFSLTGSKESFDSLFKLLEYYISSPKKGLVRPYRKEPVQSLQQLCRRRIIETCGGKDIDRIPVHPILKDFLHAFPYPL